MNITRRDFGALLLSAGLSRTDLRFLEDLRRTALRFFLEHADPKTGLVLDRARTDGRPTEQARDVASIASTGFGLTALCIGAEHGWLKRAEARDRVMATLRTFDKGVAAGERGWFYHFIGAGQGDRRWASELSSIDTALLLGGVLTARQYFAADRDIAEAAARIYHRVDFRWMLAGHPHLLSMGWKPDSGFLDARWKHYCEHNILYLLAIGSPRHAIPAESWYKWDRPRIAYGKWKFIWGDRPLFTHQFAHAWCDFRGRRERTGIDWDENSVDATLAHRDYCAVELAKKFPTYSHKLWGITASDSRKGYVAWGGPPFDERVDGTVVPCAAAGSLMFRPKECLETLLHMRQQFPATWGRYGFSDAFHPPSGWVNPDVIGIDVGITMLSAENLVTGNVRRWFMRNPEIDRAMDAVELRRV